MKNNYIGNLDYEGFPYDRYKKIPYRGMIFYNQKDKKTYKYVRDKNVVDKKMDELYQPHCWQVLNDR